MYNVIDSDTSWILNGVFLVSFLYIDRPDGNALNRLYNDLLKVLKAQGVGFRATQLDVGKIICQTIANALWLLDPHHGKLNSRGITVPEVFQRFQGYNDFKKMKKKAPVVCSHSSL